MRSQLALMAIASLLLEGAASATPVAVSATLGVEVGIPGLPPVVLAGGGAVSVMGGTITVPAGLVSQVGSLTIPVTGTSSIGSLVATGIANHSGAFSVGGVTAQAPAELCGAGPGAGQACNVGGRLGGVMALTGQIFIHIIPHITVIPLKLNGLLIGQGGAATTSFASIDAGAWTSGTGRVGLATPSGTTVVSATGASSPLNLVTPTFVNLLANRLPIFASFTLFGSLTVPEPGALWLIGSGVVGLVLLFGRAR